jgi:mRNA interferase MazF
MVRRNFVPGRGDVIWLNFNPQAGREQSGRRPALVLSAQAYNKLVGLAVVCPITSHRKGYPFEVPLTGKKISGCILADHIKNVDWKGRNALFIEVASDDVVAEVLARLAALLWT